MTATDFLSQIRLLDQTIQIKQIRLDALNAQALKTTSSLTGMPTTPHKNESSLEKAAIQIADLSEEITNDRNHLHSVQDEVTRMILASPVSAKGKTVLEMFYVNLQEWHDIALLLNREKSSIYRIHRKALREFEDFFSGSNYSACTTSQQ